MVQERKVEIIFKIDDETWNFLALNLSFGVENFNPHFVCYLLKMRKQWIISYQEFMNFWLNN